MDLITNQVCIILLTSKLNLYLGVLMISMSNTTAEKR